VKKEEYKLGWLSMTLTLWAVFDVVRTAPYPDLIYRRTRTRPKVNILSLYMWGYRCDRFSPSLVDVLTTGTAWLELFFLF
jgi:hypothetical protein